MYSLEDLRLGAKGDLGELSPGRRIQLTLGEDGCSRFMYRAVILDSKEQSGPFSYHSGVFLVPKVSSCFNVVTISCRHAPGKKVVSFIYLNNRNRPEIHGPQGWSKVGLKMIWNTFIVVAAGQWVFLVHNPKPLCHHVILGPIGSLSFCQKLNC